MAKKEMMGMNEGNGCCAGYGHCGNKWCKMFASLVAIVLGLLLIWPTGWFTPWHTVGLLVVLAGLKKFAHCCFMCK